MVFVEESATLCYVRDNHWKFDYNEWQIIEERGNRKYDVAFVTTDDLNKLLSSFRKWGCLAETNVEK